MTMRRRPGRASRSRGVASLEFVLVFPLLLMLASMIIWTAAAVTAKNRAIVEARAQAWSARHDAGIGRPFDFQELGLVRREREQTSNFRPPFLRASTPKARASHLVLGGVWDHQDVKLQKTPDWDAARRMASALPGQAASSALGAVSNFSKLVDVRSITRRIVDQELSKYASDQNELLELWRKIVGAKSDAADEARRDAEQARKTLPGRIEARKEQISGWKDQLKQVQEDEDDLDRELKDGKDRETGEKLDDEDRKDRESRRKKLEEREKALKKQIKKAESDNDRDGRILKNVDGDLEF